MKKILIFVASGLSTRMGGFPKALAKVGNTRVILNAIDCARRFYDGIFIITNGKVKPSFDEVIANDGNRAKVREIITGKGDAESVWKSLMLVQDEVEAPFDATFCWGDAYFKTPQAFKTIMDNSIEIERVKSLVVGCSVDNNPYAYFDVYTRGGVFNEMYIKKSYFQKNDGNVSKGVHDQCIFRCISSVFLGCLNRYRQEMGYDGENYLLSPNNEIGLLKSFDYLEKIGRPAEVILMPEKNVFSFNTQEELNDLIQIL